MPHVCLFSDYLDSIQNVVSLSEDASLITSLQDELKNLKEEMVQLQDTPVSILLYVLHAPSSRAALQCRNRSQ